MTAATERELLQRTRHATRQDLADHACALAAATAALWLRGYRPPHGLERDDVFAIARAAAWQAALSYDPAKGAIWPTWAIGRVKDALREIGRTPAYGAPTRGGRQLVTVPLYGTAYFSEDGSEPATYADALPDPVDAYAAADARHLLAMLQRRLSARQWEVLAGTVLADATYTEYAALIGRTCSRVQQRALDAKAAARRVLGA